MVALSLGAVLWFAYLRSSGLRALDGPPPVHFPLGGASSETLYSAASSRLLLLQSGNLRFYLRWILVFFLIVTASVWMRIDWTFDAIQTISLDARLIVLLAMTVLITMATLFIRRHVVFILVFTMTGYALGAVFLLLGAPNVALTQIVVETLIDLSIVLAMWESLSIEPNRTIMLPEDHRDWGRWSISLAVGVIGILTYISVGAQPSDPVGMWYTRESVPQAGMKDFVAAVLSDFRALDTFIEMTVFAVSILGISALYQRREARGD
jgi:multicomponent Na+:H+ antiporter subunit A